MAEIVIDRITKDFGAHRALTRSRSPWPTASSSRSSGPSGCGKTTLLRIIAGLERASAGRVLIGGRDLTDRPPRERGLAMVFQSYAVFPHMTVADNIAFGLAMQRKPKDVIDRQVRRAASLLHIEAFLDRYPAQAVRRPAAAGGGGARARRRAGGAADGRAAVEPGCAPPPRDALRAQGGAAGSRDDDHLRHARPDRGDGARRPHRRDVRRAASTRSARRCPCTPRRPPGSSAASSATLR